MREYYYTRHKQSGLVTWTVHYSIHATSYILYTNKKLHGPFFIAGHISLLKYFRTAWLMRKLNAWNNIKNNAVQGRLSENLFDTKIYCMKFNILDHNLRYYTSYNILWLPKAPPKGAGPIQSHTYPHPDRLCQSDIGVEVNLWSVDVLQWAGPNLWTRCNQRIAGIGHSSSLYDNGHMEWGMGE